MKTYIFIFKDKSYEVVSASCIEGAFMDLYHICGCGRNISEKRFNQSCEMLDRDSLIRLFNENNASKCVIKNIYRIATEI